jgi:hypothetical protein
LTVIEPPMASSARNETAPMAVLATRRLDQRRALSSEAKRVIFQRLVRDPLIIIAPNANDALLRCHELHHPKFML